MEINLGGVVDALSALIWTTRGDGRSDFVNRGWRQYTGLGAEASQGLGWQAAIHPEDIGEFLETWDVIRQTGADKEIYIRLRRFDGEYRWFTLRPSLDPERAGPEPRWCWLAMDADEGPVTDGRLRRLFDMLPIQAAFLNQAGTSEFSNRQVLHDYDMTLEQLAAWQTSGAIHQDDHPIVYEQLERLMTTGQMYDATIRMRYRDGTYRWMRCRCVPCRDAQGNIARYVTVQSDVHDLKHAEDLLAAEVKLLEMVARGEPLGRVLETLARHVEDLCRDCSCCVLITAGEPLRLQVAAAPSLPQECRDLLDGQQADAGQDPSSLALTAGTPVISGDIADDGRWTASDGPRRIGAHGYAGCCSVPILSGSGEASGVITIYRKAPGEPSAQDQALVDRFAKIAGISIDRAQAEETLNQARSELAHVARVATLNAMTASIAHEVNQPLSGILTNAGTCLRMLAQDPPNLPGVADTARRTIRDANRAAEVIKRLRAMFGRTSRVIEAFDLNEAAQDVIALSSNELRRSRVVLVTDFAPELPIVHGDRVQLQQVILNLLLNGADAMSAVEDRPRTLRVTTDLDNPDGVTLSVRDAGVGLDPQVAAKVFEAFYTTKPNGMGIGLSISRSIIESHDGSLWAKPNDGPGATFGFRVPCGGEPSAPR